MRPSLYLFFFFVLFLCCKQESSTAVKDLPTVEKDSIKEPQPKPKELPIWTDVPSLIPDALVDIRYATENNFVGEVLYECPACLLRPPAAEALARIANSLRQKGFRLILFDCYRPGAVQERLWEIMPNATYVTPPSKGSMHNRGLAVDVGLATLEGVPLDMGTEYDFFGRPAHHDYFDLPQDVLERRTTLKETMASEGFKHIRSEWWHY
ncbi:MAG: M15 family metallopeptidase, partial [Saprospiraceae bacterium]|nr:M15 family metallopeptidase [Saprospiraceae bacterium]